jgi:hypothetical protein
VRNVLGYSAIPTGPAFIALRATNTRGETPEPQGAGSKRP